MKLKIKISIILKSISLFCLAIGLLSIFWRFYLVNYYQSQIFSVPTEISPGKTAIVLGASAKNFYPSPVLKDRIEAAVDLYKQGKVENILMSGDNRFNNYNEPEVMTRYATKLGVPVNKIYRDYAGRRTYDTCFRAKHIFQIKEAILVTSKFHLPRTLYTCEQLGIKVDGFYHDNRNYYWSTYLSWQLRETIATSVAWVNINIVSSQPVLGEPLPIQ